MAAGQGLLNRDITITIGGGTIAGVITRDFSITNSAIEVTDDQSSGWREVLAKGGLKSLDLGISGTIKNYELLDTVMNSSSQMVACVVDLGDGTTTESNLTFDAFLSEVSFGGDANERVDYSASLISSGAVTYTAGS